MNWGIVGAPAAKKVIASKDATAIIEQCKANLADFKVPRAVYFKDDFPKATLDKVAKNKLREEAETLELP